MWTNLPLQQATFIQICFSRKRFCRCSGLTKNVQVETMVKAVPFFFCGFNMNRAAKECFISGQMEIKMA
jgi:hypothetical protein